MVPRLVERQPEGDEALLRGLADDPTRALDELYNRYARLVYGIARAILGSTAEAEDLTQEVFLRLCRESRYDPQRGTLAAYLITVTRSRALDMLRSTGRKLELLRRWGSEIARDGATSDPVAEASLTERTRCVRQALARLPDNQRRVLELAYFGELSQSEIASRMDAPLGTVKTWARRGLFALRDSLKDVAR